MPDAPAHGAPPPQTKTPKPRTYVSIQYLRAVAALMVVAWHAQGQMGLRETRFFQGGIEIFFVVSGFVMWGVSSTGTQRPGAFVARRLARVVPLYWALTSVVLCILILAPRLLQTTRFDIRHVVASYLFIPWPNPAPGVGMKPLMIPGWTLNYEMAFYGLIAVSLYVPSRWRAGAVIGLLLAAPALGTLGPSLSDIGRFYTSPLVADFALGIGLALLVRRAPPGLARFAPLAFGLGCGLLVAAGAVIDDAGSWRLVLFGLPAVLIVGGAVTWERASGHSGVKAFVLLGDASYPLYMIHPLLLSAMAQGWRQAGLAVLPASVFVICGMAATTAAGVILHLWLERPMTRALQARLAAGRPRHDKAKETKNAAPRPLVRASFGLVNRGVMLLDAAVVIAGAGGAYVLSPHPAPLTAMQTALVALIGALAFTITLQGLNAYRVEQYQRVGQAWDIVLGLIVAAAADRVVVWAFSPEVLGSNLWLLAWTAGTFAGLVLGRGVAGAALRRLVRAGGLRRRVAVIGSGALSQTFLQRLQGAGPEEDYALVGVFDDQPSPERFGDIETLRRLGQHTQIDLIVIAPAWSDPMALLETAERVQSISADIVVLLDREDRLGRASQRVQVAGMAALKLVQHPLRGAEGLVKAAQDYTVAALALVLLAPVMAAAALAVRLSGEGPILFRQARIGLNGRPFTIYKFRTMTVDPADDGSRGAAPHDPRVTRVGAVLRRTSVDELPQLFNVLAGDMSIVGPRPHTPNMRIGEGAYAQAVRAYAGRHQIKPGITGWAQINGMRGVIDSLSKARQGVDLDLYYIRNWSLKLDLAIMGRTLTRLMGRDVY